MIRMPLSPRLTFFTGSIFALVLALSAHGQKKEPHFRKTKELPPASDITLTVQKAANGKPLENAAVIFHAKSHDGTDQGSMEVKTNAEGQAKIDIIEIGSHVTVQVIADGYASGAADFDVLTPQKDVLVKMEKPRAQVSTYIDNDGKASQLPPGVQEPRPIAPRKPAAAPVAPATSSPQ